MPTAHRNSNTMGSDRMYTVTVNTASPYTVHVGSGLLSRSGERITSALSSRRCALVADSAIPMYAETVRTALERAGVSVFVYMLEASEQNKTLAACTELLSFFARHELTRADFAVALGGGVTGDMVGFAASIYQRGIDFVQIPTTLLAAVDASVGGKTAVDLPEGKNLAGAFHQPRMVICDTETFHTLPSAVFAEGMAEVTKHALIADPALLKTLSSETVSDIDELVRRNIEIKASFVCGDEREHGKRKLLNFGHTVGHAIERCSGYTVPHGEAVSIGMAMMCRAGERLGFTPAGTYPAVCKLLNAFSLPTACSYSAGELFSAAAADKKRSGDEIDIVILREMGRAEALRIPFADLRQWMEAAL